jgi:hypothetical protein
LHQNSVVLPVRSDPRSGRCCAPSGSTYIPADGMAIPRIREHAGSSSVVLPCHPWGPMPSNCRSRAFYVRTSVVPTNSCPYFWYTETRRSRDRRRGLSAKCW